MSLILTELRYILLVRVIDEAEVTNHEPIAQPEEIVWLDVSMGDAFCMKVGEGSGDGLVGNDDLLTAAAL